MSTELKRFTKLHGPGELPEMLAHPDMFDTESLGISIDLGPMRAVVDKLLADRVPGAARTELTPWDEAMVEPLHMAFTEVPHRLVTDMRLWHWLCCGIFRGFVLARWCSEEAAEKFDSLTAPEAGRFLGRATLNGVSRNALARLFWCGQALWDEESGYKLARAALHRQDLFQQIFERQFGLYRPAARACVNKFADSTQPRWRRGTRALNFCLTTMTVELMDEPAVTALLEQFST